MAELTAAQLTTLAAHIRASGDAAVAAALAGRNDTELARLYNLDSAVWIWRDAIEPDEYRAALVWTEVDTLLLGGARIWEWLTAGMSIAIDATDPNVRKGIADAFDGTTATRANLLAIGKRLATVFESIYATAAGAGTEANPTTAAVAGPVTIQNIGRALNDNP